MDRILVNYHHSNFLNKIIQDIRQISMNNGKTSAVFPLKEMEKDYKLYYELIESEYTNYIYNIVEAKPEISMLNIRKLQYNSLEFKGIVGMIMNQDPKNDSYKIEKMYDSVYFVPQLNLVNQFVIYTDIIEQQYYGGQQQLVLHTLNLSKNAPPIIDSPHYVNVNKAVVTSINIRICDRTGQPIKFSDLFSNVLVKLHFRKK